MKNKEQFVLRDFEEDLTAITEIDTFRVGDIVQYHPDWNSSKEKFVIYTIEKFTKIYNGVPGNVKTQFRVRLRSVTRDYYHGTYIKSFPFVKVR